MATTVYFPAPGVYVGGRQPYDSRDLSPAIEDQANNPPFRRKTQTQQLANIASSWFFPPGVYVGGRQPNDSRDLSPQFENVQEDAPPPFGGKLRQVPAVWWTVYFPAQTLYESTPGLSDVIDTSFLRQPSMPSPAWWAQYPTPQQRADMSPGIPGQSVDDPPRFRVPTPQTSQPIPIYDLQRRYVVQPFVAGTAESAPFAQAWINVLRSWQRGPDLPLLPRNLSPQLTAVPEDSPVFSHPGRTPNFVQLTAWFAGVLPNRPSVFEVVNAAPPGWSVDDPPRFRPLVVPPQAPTPLWVQYPKLPQDGGAPVVPLDQPFSGPQLALRWWVAQAPPPVQARQLAPGVPGQSVDAPPGRPGWQPGAAHYEAPRLIVLPRLLSPGVPGQSVDLPPSIAARQPARAWYEGLYPATQPRSFVPGQAQVDAPSVRTSSYGWSTQWWFAPYVAPQRHRPLAPQLTAVRVDDPPFDARRLGRLASIVSQTQVPRPDEVHLRYVVQEGPAYAFGSVICGSIVIRPMLSTEILLMPATSASPTAGPALSGDPDVEECD